MAKVAPAKTKYRKVQKGRVRGNAKGGTRLTLGDFAIQTLERGKITADQLEAARVAITRHLKRRGKLVRRVFPQKPMTQKPAETRMGRGKGPVEFWTAVVRPGNILFELAGVSATLAREAMSLADAKLPVRCRFISRELLEQY